MKRVHQVLASAVPGDAVTDQAFAWRTMLRYWGYESEIIAEHVHPALSGHVQQLDARRPRGRDAVVLHYAVWSRALEWFLGAPGPRVLCYHNVTPGDLLRDYNRPLAELCDQARAALPDFRNHCEVVVADSQFNADDLRSSGVSGAQVVPLLLNLSSRAPVRQHRSEVVILSVGRLAPNKRLEDTLKAFALYQRHHAAEAMIVHVGPYHEFDGYRRALEDLAGRIGVRNVRITGRVSREERDWWFRRADAYICSSIHEGFCAPIVEALANGVPVVARAAGAVPETLGRAGVLLDGDGPAVYAEALREVVSSSGTRRALISAGEHRVGELAPHNVAPRLAAALRPVLRGA